MNQRVREVVYVVVAVGIMAMVIMFIASYIRLGHAVDTIRSTQQNGSPILIQMQEQQDQIAALAHRIKSCTTPSGQCYKRGTRRTGEAVAGINGATMRVVVAALTCQSDGVTGRKALARCTVARSTPLKEKE